MFELLIIVSVWLIKLSTDASQRETVPVAPERVNVAEPAGQTVVFPPDILPDVAPITLIFCGNF